MRKAAWVVVVASLMTGLGLGLTFAWLGMGGL